MLGKNSLVDTFGEDQEPFLADQVLSNFWIIFEFLQKLFMYGT